MNKIRRCILRTHLFVNAMLNRIRAAMERLVPMGYEDDNGFHLGVEDRLENRTR